MGSPNAQSRIQIFTHDSYSEISPRAPRDTLIFGHYLIEGVDPDSLEPDQSRLAKDTACRVPSSAAFDVFAEFCLLLYKLPFGLSEQGGGREKLQHHFGTFLFDVLGT